MKKSKEARAINQIVRKINKQIAADVFGNRFYIRQVMKARGTDSCEYFLYELIDREDGSRNRLFKRWICGYTDKRLMNSEVAIEMNNFIIESDFWTKYRSKEGIAA